MTDVNVLDLIPEDEKPTTEVTEKPEWTKFDPLAELAYDAMLELEAKKQAFIKRHRDKADYVVKSNYTITKTEVAKACDKTHANMIFKSNPRFATPALTMFEKINKELVKSKTERLEKEATGLRARNKREVVKEAQSRANEIKRLKAELAKNAYDALLSNLPLDVVQTLKLSRR